jgi:hypothetical protein
LDEFGPILHDWDRPTAGKVALETMARAVYFDRQEDAEKWFEDRLTTHRQAGFFKFACSLGGHA